MPQRDDFERDYNHEAESLVSSLFLNPAEDDDLDIALKLAQVDMYTNNLRERARRKRVVRDYQLVSAFFVSSRKEKGVKKKQTKEEKYGKNLIFYFYFAINIYDVKVKDF
jgi:transcriptional adapter 2-beta